jgi:hypothetical protein
VPSFNQGRYIRPLGIFLARRRYANESQWFKRSIALYGAMLVNPVLIRDRRVSARVDPWATAYLEIALLGKATAGFQAER